MKTHLRVFAIVVFILVIGCGTASAYSKSENMQSVVINIDGAPRMVSTDKTTVGELLADLENTIDTEYFLEGADESDPIEAMMTLSLTSVTEKTVAETKTIPYKTIEKENPNMEYGESKVIQEGKDGVSTIISKEIYHGTELMDTKFVEEKVTTAAQNKIVEVGTAHYINGVRYTKAISAKVTAYTPFDAGCNGITASGTKAGYGTVAVDPKVIPLGSKVYIPGYGTAIATDTGGAIKGNRVDVCYGSKAEAFGWGVRNTTVYVLA
ncbi:3D domain-containing protein [Anaerotignum sp.]|nr:3D domain-containing protein [Anaerotignum sp.]MBQ7758189.1 G5 domain-containing protein [Anaerotignum sp.]